MTHPDAETLLRHTRGLLGGAEASQVGRHVTSCPTCAGMGTSLGDFSTRLDREWVATRVRVEWPDWACPTADEISEYFLEAGSPAEGGRIRGHLQTCARCHAVLTEMETGAAELQRVGLEAVPEPRPLDSGGSWWVRLREALGVLPWPAWAGAAVTVGVVFALGVVSRPLLLGPPAPAVGPGIQIAKPPLWLAPDVPTLGIAPAVNPEAERKFREAMIFHGDADFANRALPSLQEAVAIDPSHDQAQFWLGVVQLLRGETEAAIPPLEAAVRLAPARAEHGQYLVWAYLRIGALDKALRLQTDLLDRSVSGDRKGG